MTTMKRIAYAVGCGLAAMLSICALVVLLYGAGLIASGVMIRCFGFAPIATDAITYMAGVVGVAFACIAYFTARMERGE
jgi:hypothetical protein